MNYYQYINWNSQVSTKLCTLGTPMTYMSHNKCLFASLEHLLSSQEECFKFFLNYYMLKTLLDLDMSDRFLEKSDKSWKSSSDRIVGRRADRWLLLLTNRVSLVVHARWSHLDFNKPLSRRNKLAVSFVWTKIYLLKMLHRKSNRFSLQTSAGKFEQLTMRFCCSESEL